ncbi:hypothetical protein DDZ14_01740 [Maritimibacter sp. 55A14]|uniref:hypothetical protein n=1 Tax=Maritimibacter sp. 55A14 TaxID=2174844 RepID=UPI000D61C44B|nr:hypothetical protein [Maritimibacter sp. 55A14]PWE33916.1 hypothetical protein DDZ14_01740 [Maritimibacter sp. 55A14]
MVRMKAIFLLVAALLFAAAPTIYPGFKGIDPQFYPNPQADPPIVPAGYAFAIWGLLYLWLILHAGFGLLNRSDDPGWDRARWPLIVSLTLGSVWLGVAMRAPLQATALIWVMLAGALIALFAAARVGDRWWFSIPLGLYAGWLTAASWVALGLSGAGYGLIFGETGWAVAALLGALGMAALVQSRLPQAPSYGLAVIWALAAIVAGNAGEAPAIAALAGLGALALAGLLIRQRLAA